MGVELRSFQRQFHVLMDTMKPQVRPRFVVWLDERLAEFKVKGHMDLEESLEDPQWIKTFVACKRQAKELAIRKREAREATSSGSGSVVFPKDEVQSESSNGRVHPGDIPEESKEIIKSEEKLESTDLGTDFKIVEVKQEHGEGEEDDDMIIVGETLAPSLDPQEHASGYIGQFNSNRQLAPNYRNTGFFQRKRQKLFSTVYPRPTSLSAGYKFKCRMKSTLNNPQSSKFSSQTVTSSPYTLTSSSRYQSQPLTFSSNSPQLYNENLQTQTYDDSVTFAGNDAVRLPSDIQSESVSADMQLTESGYVADENELYIDYGDESYDSSYMAGSADSADTSLQYDEEGNALIQTVDPTDNLSLDPKSGTSEGTSQGDIEDYYSHTLPSHLQTSKSFPCFECGRTFALKTNLFRHIACIHRKLQPFVCVCGRRFGLKNNLLRHINSSACSNSPNMPM